MKRDSVKTGLGLIVIGGIVVATYLYGNQQREAQLKQDQTVRQQEAKVTPKASAPVVTPQTKPSAVPVVASDGAGSPTVIPDTGAGELGMLAGGIVIASSALLSRSRRRLTSAIRTRG